MSNITNATVVSSLSKRRASNVEYPAQVVQEYYPWVEYQNKATELDSMITQINADKKRGRKVSIFFYFSPPGMGKTVAGYYLAWLYSQYDNCPEEMKKKVAPFFKAGKKPVQVVNCNGSMQAFNLLGQKSSDGSSDGLVWEDGAIPSVIRAAEDDEYGLGFLVLNEFNALRPEAQIAFNSLMDGQDKVVLLDNNNEVVRLNKGHLVIIASGNPGFLGTNDLQESVRDRVEIWVDIKIPDPLKEAQLLERLTGLELEQCKNFTKFAQKMREAYYVSHTLTLAPSPRSLKNWIELAAIHGVIPSFEMTMLNKFSQDDNEKKFLIQLSKDCRMSTWSVPMINLYSDAPAATTVPPIKISSAVPLRTNLRDLGKEMKKAKTV